MFEWEELFRPHILERGWRYAQSGAVSEIQKSKDCISAIVSGNEFYKVEFDYDDGEVVNGFCTCPYATKGEMCKHMAAVLYVVDLENESLDNHKEVNAINEAKTERTLSEIVKSASRDELEKIILELACIDDNVEKRIIASLDKSLGALEINSLKKEIDGIFYNFSDSSRYINYQNAFKFEMELTSFIDKRTKDLIKNNMYMEAFDVSMYAFVKLGNWDIDDDGEISSISSCCYELWQEIISNCSNEEKVKIRQWFEEHSDDGTVIDYMEFALQDFLKYELASNVEMKSIIANLETIVEQCKGAIECKSVFTEYYGYSVEAIKLRNIFMKRLGATDEDIEEYMRNYMSFRSVRQYFIDKAEEEGDIDEEIRLLKQSKIYERDESYYLHNYSQRLIDIYIENKDFDLEKRERKEDIMSNQNASMADYRAYRSMCSDEEWWQEKTLIINSRESIDMKCELLAEEKMIDELFELICDQDDKLKYINKYGFLMSNKYSQEILKYYNDFVSELAEHACNRYRYNKLTSYLTRMSKYPNGKELVQQLSSEWINKYPTRKVMVEELERYSCNV